MTGLGNREGRLLRLLFLFSLASMGLPTSAQVAVRQADIPAAQKVFDSRSKQNSLKCDAHSWGPAIGFNFLYGAGYTITAGMEQFAPGDRINIYARVTPKGGSSLLLREFTRIPTADQTPPHSLDPKNLKKFNLRASGGFNVGTGSYTAEILLLGEHGRSCYKHWELHTGKYPEKAGPPVLAAQTVTPLAHTSWDGKLDPHGIRLTVLLNAAPLFPFSNQLYAWDRSVLLDALASLLKQMPSSSVHVIAFNLEQQREFFHDEKFDANGFSELDVSLHNLELSTVSVKALERGSSANFLQRLAEQQLSARETSDAVVFFGPVTRFRENPRLESGERTSQHFFDVEFDPIGFKFTDSIQHITRDLHGSVYFVNSSNDLAAAIQKIQAQVRPSQSDETSRQQH